MPKFDHFNFISSVYDRVFGRRLNHNTALLADVKNDALVLDIGGGTGRVASLFTSLTTRVIVIDAAMKMLREAKRKGIKSINAHAEYLPFPDGFFDRLIMVDAFHHLENQEKTIQEMWRVLSIGGQIVIEEPDINHFYVKLIALAEKLLFMRSHFVQPDKIAELCSFDQQMPAKVIRDGGNAWIIIKKHNQVHGKE